MSQSSRLLRILTLHCDAASELASRELDELLPLVDRAALLCHILVCNSCRRFRVQIRLVRMAIRRREQLLAQANPTTGGLSEEARNRIARACREIGDPDAGAEISPE